MNGRIKKELDELSFRDLVTWVIGGLLALVVFLAKGELEDIDETLKKVETTLTSHLINHPDSELDKRLTVLESKVN